MSHQADDDQPDPQHSRSTGEFQQAPPAGPQFNAPGVSAGQGTPNYPAFQPGSTQYPGVPGPAQPEAFGPAQPGALGAETYPSDPYAQRAQSGQFGQVPAAVPQPAMGSFTAPAVAGPSVAPENVARGVLYALGGVLVGVVLAVLVYRLGFIASVTTYVMALLVLRLYAIGSGGQVRKGVVPVVVLLVLGVVLTIMGYVGGDAFRYYGEHAGPDAGISRASFVWKAMTTPRVYSDYGRDIFLTILFAVLGVFSTLRGLMPGRRRR